MAAELVGLIGERVSETDSGQQAQLTYLVKHAKNAPLARAAVVRSTGAGALALNDPIAMAPGIAPGGAGYAANLICKSLDAQPTGIESLRPDPDQVAIPHGNVLAYEVVATFQPPGGSISQDVQLTNWSIGISAFRLDCDRIGRPIGERRLFKPQPQGGIWVPQVLANGRSLIDEDASVGADGVQVTVDFEVQLPASKSQLWRPDQAISVAGKVNDGTFTVTPFPGALPVFFERGECLYLGANAQNTGGPTPHTVSQRFTAGRLLVPARAAGRSYDIVIWNTDTKQYEPYSGDDGGAVVLPMVWGRFPIFTHLPEEVTEGPDGQPLPQPRPPNQGEIKGRRAVALALYEQHEFGSFSGLRVT